MWKNSSRPWRYILFETRIRACDCEGGKEAWRKRRFHRCNLLDVRAVFSRMKFGTMYHNMHEHVAHTRPQVRTPLGTNHKRQTRGEDILRRLAASLRPFIGPLIRRSSRFVRDFESCGDGSGSLDRSWVRCMLHMRELSVRMGELPDFVAVMARAKLSYGGTTGVDKMVALLECCLERELSHCGIFVVPQFPVTYSIVTLEMCGYHWSIYQPKYRSVLHPHRITHRVVQCSNYKCLGRAPWAFAVELRTWSLTNRLMFTQHFRLLIQVRYERVFSRYQAAEDSQKHRLRSSLYAMRAKKVVIVVFCACVGGHCEEESKGEHSWNGQEVVSGTRTGSSIPFKCRSRYPLQESWLVIRSSVLIYCAKYWDFFSCPLYSETLNEILESVHSLSCQHSWAEKTANLVQSHCRGTVLMTIAGFRLESINMSFKPLQLYIAMPRTLDGSTPANLMCKAFLCGTRKPK